MHNPWSFFFSPRLTPVQEQSASIELSRNRLPTIDACHMSIGYSIAALEPPWNAFPISDELDISDITKGTKCNYNAFLCPPERTIL
jgi:hypothetical protein